MLNLRFSSYSVIDQLQKNQTTKRDPPAATLRSVLLTRIWHPNATYCIGEKFHQYSAISRTTNSNIIQDFNFCILP